MKLIITIIFLIVSSISASNNVGFLSDPAPSPNGDKIVFAYDEDLWIVSVDGGTAMRITGMKGRESNPVYSPDGKWIAFSSRQDGDANVYLLPVDGGKIIQLTYHEANDIVDSWSWDSKYIYFTSSRYNNLSSYKVSVDGGTPVRLFDNFFNIPHNIAEHPTSGEIFFNETWESGRFAHRKRYKGDYNPDIKSYNIKSKEFKVYTNYRGKDFWTTIDQNGEIYFVSDEANNEYNLYTFKNNKKTQLTNFSTSIKRPRVNVKGSVIVFEKDYRLYKYLTSTNKSELVNVSPFINRTLKKSQSFNTKGKITNYDVSPDNKKIAFISRGELFVGDIEGKLIKQLYTNPKERVEEVKWLKDNKTLLYNQTVKGWLNLFKIDVVTGKKELQLTFDKRNNKKLQLNNELSRAVYYSGRDRLMLIDLDNFETEVLAEDEFWALRPTPAYFSPDDNFIVYAAYRDFEQDIFVYNLTKKKSIQITKTGVTETDPYWSPDGKYLYFNTDRFRPSYPYGMEDSEIYRIALQDFDRLFKSTNLEKVFVESAKEDKKKDKSTSKVKVVIDPDKMKDRWERVLSFRGNQSGPVVFEQNKKTILIYSSSHDSNGRFLWKTEIDEYGKKKTDKIKGSKRASLPIIKVKKDVYALVNGTICKLNLKANKVAKIVVSIDFSKKLRDEFEQMFYQTWANLGENYYDENYHGIDWDKTKLTYEKYLALVNTRADLRILTNDMLGELNSSHQGFSSNGDEEKVVYKYRTQATGIVFANNKPFVVDRIVANSNADTKNIDIQKGDELIAVNDIKLVKGVNREKYFIDTKLQDEIKLTFLRSSKPFDVKIHPQRYTSFRSNLYDEWVNGNQERVDNLSDKKIAYVHMKNMGGGELNNFLIEMSNEANYRDGLILDLRYNRGGNVHNNVLQFLSQRHYLNWKYRNGKLAQQPNFSPADKPIILLINEQSLSDAEMTAAGYKALGLGKIIGTESYRWIIFTSGNSLVDGSFYRLPSWGCYTKDGQDLEFTGVAPDIYIKNTFKDKLLKKDPQIEKAVEVIKNSWK